MKCTSYVKRFGFTSSGSEGNYERLWHLKKKKKKKTTKNDKDEGSERRREEKGKGSAWQHTRKSNNH